MRQALAHLPMVDFPAPANIGGVDPTPMQSAVPTLDPKLAIKATPKPKPAPSPKKKK
jgi:hypothetical protein